jgi:alkaline phosphatase
MNGVPERKQVMKYVDGYVLVVPKKNLPAYRKMAATAAKVWMDHGAIEYRECVGEDLKSPCGIAFPKLTNAKTSDTVVFSWITYKSRAQRDKVNAAVMKDPRIAKMMSKKPPFDMSKMACGGFETIVEG